MLSALDIKAKIQRYLVSSFVIKKPRKEIGYRYEPETVSNFKNTCRKIQAVVKLSSSIITSG